MGIRVNVLAATAACFLAPTITLAHTPAGFSAEPPQDPGFEDGHTRPAYYDDDALRPDIIIPPSAGSAEYPLAATFVPAHSSNYSADGISYYEYVVVHTVQGSYAGAISWFQNPNANVSAHYVLRSGDGEVTQMLHNDDRGWHVGSQNSWSVGIEHEGWVDDASWYTWAMYESSARLARWIADTHGIPVDRDHIRGHVELPMQSHTDPGGNWNWDMYMAIIWDLVGEGEIDGYVVDRSRACTLTANTDTYVKTTLEPAASLQGLSKCFVSAGTELTYVFATDDMYGHRRLIMEGGNGCGGALEVQAYAFADHFDGFCPREQMAASGTAVSLDGGPPVNVSADGGFLFMDLGAGDYDLDVDGGAGYYGTSEVVSLEVFPGLRPIVVVDPLPAGTTGDPTTAGTSGGTSGAETSAGTSGSSGTSGAGDSTGDLSSGTDGTGFDTSSLPDGYGQSDTAGCGCRGGDAPGPWWLGLPVLVLVRRRRR